MKNTSQQYLNSEAHGYLMEAKACKLLLKDLERIRAKLKRHIEKEAADREAEFEAAMQYHSESDIQEAYGWEFISEQQYAILSYSAPAILKNSAGDSTVTPKSLALDNLLPAFSPQTR